MVGVAVIVTLAGGLAFAGRRSDLFQRLDRAYAEWSLQSRVNRLARVRLKGEVNKVKPFIIDSCTPRAQVGSAIEYVSMEIEDFRLEDDVAIIALATTYRIPALGITKPQALTLEQRWVRAGGTWYWDPGEPVSGGTVRMENSPIHTNEASTAEGR